MADQIAVLDHDPRIAGLRGPPPHLLGFGGGPRFGAAWVGPDHLHQESVARLLWWPQNV